ncbi:MAG: Cas10/Cmr2 second palm domain-containing protein [Egibacteraceae bacterium]
MPTYLDIGAVRIQSYLARTQPLKARRGASAALSEATGQRELRRLGAELNPEAGEADGTVHLIVPDGGSAEDLGLRVMIHLRERLPAAEFQAAWGDGPDYVSAYEDEIRPRFERGDVLVSLPPRYEFPATRNCETCGQHPVETTISVDGEVKGICADCGIRFGAAGHRRLGTGAGTTSEDRLLCALGRAAADRVDSFDQLARLGSRKQNHLATVYIDGNAVGDFFGRLLAAGSPHKAELSRGFAEATWTALAQAAGAIPDQPLPVIPHVVGGDDVLASVTAEFALTFVRTYLTTFTSTLRECVKEHAAELVDQTPTASAGVVFAHATYPFDRCVHVAEGLLRRAKRRDRGRSPSLLWVDVTREGESPPPERRAWTLDEIAGREDDLAELAGLGKSARASLHAAVSHRDDQVAAALALRWARRNQQLEVVTGLLGTPADAQILRDALDLTHWW